MTLCCTGAEFSPSERREELLEVQHRHVVGYRRGGRGRGVTRRGVVAGTEVIDREVMLDALREWDLYVFQCEPVA